MKQYINRLIREESGTEIIEYCMVIIIVMGLVVTLCCIIKSLSSNVQNTQNIIEASSFEE